MALAKRGSSRQLQWRQQQQQQQQQCSSPVLCSYAWRPRCWCFPPAHARLDRPPHCRLFHCCSHVYNVGVPPTAAEYLHRAGRAGRIGSPVQGWWASWEPGR